MPLDKRSTGRLSEGVHALLVEDNAGDTLLVQEYLVSDSNYKFLLNACSRLSEAMELLSKACFDIVLLDLSLPDSHGLDCVSRISGVCGDAPIVVLTSLDDEGLAKQALRQGAKDYLIKDQISPQVLQRSILYAIERKGAVQALAESEKLYRNLFENSLGFIYTHDLSGILTSVNPAAAKALGYQPLEMIGRNLAEFVDPLVRSLFSQYLQLIRSEKIRSGVIRLSTRDGIDRIWQYRNCLIADEGNEPYVLGDALDITDRVKAEEALGKSEKRYRTLFEDVPVGVYRTTPDGEILNANPALIRMLGYESFDEIATRNLEAPPFEPQYSRSDFHERMARDGEVIGLEAEWRRRDGSVIFARENARAIRDSDGTILCYEGTVEDITERRKIEKMKDDLISVVAHELRIPLTSIRGSLDYLASKMGQDLPATAKQLVNMASKGTERLIRLINDLLDLDKIESGAMTFDFKPHNIKSLIEHAFHSNKPYADQFGVNLAVDIVPSVMVNVDSDRFIQVMTNLLSNAVKFSPENETVTISALYTGDSVRISVRDCGPGIPEKFHSRIFQKFSQADSLSSRQKGGSGLGLSITKAIVEKFGGKIGFETYTNAGTTFYFDLPWHSDPS
ncbi:PAS domain S-box protein [bacterium]|nr:PAS domain S-box protein [bacterium]